MSEDVQAAYTAALECLASYQYTYLSYIGSPVTANPHSSCFGSLSLPPSLTQIIELALGTLLSDNCPQLQPGLPPSPQIALESFNRWRPTN